MFFSISKLEHQNAYQLYLRHVENVNILYNIYYLVGLSCRQKQVCQKKYQMYQMCQYIYCQYDINENVINQANIYQPQCMCIKTTKLQSIIFTIFQKTYVHSCQFMLIYLLISYTKYQILILQVQILKVTLKRDIDRQSCVCISNKVEFGQFKKLGKCQNSYPNLKLSEHEVHEKVQNLGTSSNQPFKFRCTLKIRFYIKIQIKTKITQAQVVNKALTSK
eukprot:TRINITY_DN38975_c0_g2_i1.p1 TRINITY_DN38975_c0_g2~~TRINITY_DN38975_c0_g2_i1.p1  ORF type:complete len:220 (-),score=-20.29 TRINITY_DN38975_c0_g2_i1:368-1027(-)